MKKVYIDLMEKALLAYSDEHIMRCFNEVKTNGLTEHGFPRLTANIGILISYGKRKDLLPIFLEMMEFCCKKIPTVKAANDFSVREIVCCLLEVERSKIVDRKTTSRWRNYLATIEPTNCYNVYAKTPTDTVHNWALFTAVSEYFRQSAGICQTQEFIDLQLQQQLTCLDENGMYKDNMGADCHQPIVYDLVPRGLFSLLLDSGYRGKHYAAIDEALKKAALVTLGMQSPNGEIAFGGRSNQFVFNEAWMIAIFEYEAKRYVREGNTILAKKMKAAAARALNVTKEWLAKKPIYHTKNRFATESKFGCEGYAYFDKYMITVASNLYVAHQICDETIAFSEELDREPCVAKTSSCFHKLFLKSGGYGLEFDLNGDTHYDANGLGRVHRDGAPCTICLSCPCPAEPVYKVDIDAPFAFSACGAKKSDDGWQFGAQKDCIYEEISSISDDALAQTKLRCVFLDGSQVEENYSVSEKGVTVTVQGDGEVGFALPAFDFDGETYTEIAIEKRRLTIAYGGWICRYETDGEIINLHKIAANRNGHYQTFIATAPKCVRVKIEIIKA